MTHQNGGQSTQSSYSEASPFVRLLKTPGRVKIVDVFLEKHYEELTAQDIADLAGISRSTVSRNIDVLLDAELIEQSGQAGNTPLYQLNTESEVAKALGKAQAELLSQSDEIPRLSEPGLPFDPDEVHLQEDDTNPMNLRQKVDSISDRA